MSIKTLDLDALAAQTGNIFESVAIAAKRSRQVASKTKQELDNKLAYFEGFEPELEDPRFQEEQKRISVEFEVRAEPTEIAIGEMLEGDIYYREAAEEEEEETPEEEMEL
ncbi:MAG: DNA-directed RNA polymerase subunit omega [Rhodothermales bacterium]|nr:DNA-directed RNA polymerase subunit omega [Rhodothermales bacterium]